MRLTRHLFAFTLVAGIFLASALAPAAPTSTKSTKAKPTAVHKKASATKVAARPVSNKTTKKLPPVPASAQAGMIVSIDSETGALRLPSQDELQSLMGSGDAAIDNSDEGLVQVHHPNGMVSIDLQGRFQEYAVVRIAPNGRKVFDCVPTRQDIARLLTTPAPARALEEK
jgi:hypothetical protein